jgi:hypothetical protein
MALTNEQRMHFEGVQQVLEIERAELQQQIADAQKKLVGVCQGLSTISAYLITDSPLSSSLKSTPAIASHRYASMSVHWAILDLLLDSQQPMTTAEIADALLARGVKTRAAHFANNVSAVLGTTLRDTQKEVEQLPDNKWALTERGKSKIEYIRTTPKFRAAVSGVRSFARF